ncbi:MAG: hypothetical protein OXQ94_04395 [Gemmatimonadota bacterium]|nr:hypothetical protein [Gemmatimonadota bacterium]MDE2870913.1 hypothetical protein [Gemmatimonadota bacterium]
MNGTPEHYRLERVEQAKGKLFVYQYCGDDSSIPDHRVCAPCWNVEKLTVILHERVAHGSAQMKCPKCEWFADLEKPSPS